MNLADEARLADLLLRNQGPDASKTGASADYVRQGSAYRSKPGAPVHVVLTATYVRDSTLCGRSINARTYFGPDHAVTCRKCAEKLATLRAQPADT